MDLSIITVNTNDKDKLIIQAASVKEAGDGVIFEQIISDNGSTDGSVSDVRQLFPGAKIIENGGNIGFGAANNRAAEISKGEFLLFLNPDMRLAPGSLKKIVDWMRARPEVGIASCKLVDENGLFSESAKPRRFPTVWNQIIILLKLPHIFPWVLDNYLYKGFNPDKEQEVDSVRGSFFLMRRELYQKLGWAFDPRYFIWFEDVDTCREAKRLGYRVFYTPIISCVDYVGQSFKKVPSFKKQKWFTASMVKYFKKWEPWYKWMPIAALRPVGIFLVWLPNVIKKK